MKITFKEDYTDAAGKLFKENSVWDIFDPAAADLIASGVAEAVVYDAVKYRVRPSMILDAGGNRMEVVEPVVEETGDQEENDEPRPKGKDS